MTTRGATMPASISDTERAQWRDNNARLSTQLLRVEMALGAGINESAEDAALRVVKQRDEALRALMIVSETDTITLPHGEDVDITADELRAWAMEHRLRIIRNEGPSMKPLAEWLSEAVCLLSVFSVLRRSNANAHLFHKAAESASEFILRFDDKHKEAAE